MHPRPLISLLTTDTGVSVRKTYPASAPAEASQREAAWLRAAASVEGVVQLIEAEPHSVTTVHAGGTTLRSQPPGPALAASLLARVADTIGQLESLDMLHGQLTPDHIITNGHKTYLCSPNVDPQSSMPDLVGLGRCCTELLGEWDRQDLSIPNRPGWEQLARRLCEGDEALGPAKVASALRSIGGERVAPNNARTPRVGKRRAAVTGAACLVGAVSGLLGFGLLRHALKQTPADVGVGPEVVVGRDLYRVGHRPGEALAINPRCAGQPAVILLDDTKTAWVFQNAEPHQPGRRLATIPGATDLQLSTVDGCAVVHAEGPAGAVQLEINR